MKRFFIFLFLCGVIFLLGSPRVRGATSPEDRYVVIYNVIQEAETLNEAGSATGALAKYQEAQAALENFQTEFPDWNQRIVSFRLDYLTTKITPLAARVGTVPPPRIGAPVAVPTPIPAPQPLVSSDVTKQLRALQEQVRQAQTEKAQLEARLKETPAAQAPAIDAAQAAREADRIKALEKQNEQLKAELEQQQARAAQRIEPAVLEQTRQVLEDVNRKLAQQQEATGTLTREKETLQKQVDALSASGTVDAKTAAELEQTKRTLDEALRKLVQETGTASALAKEKEAMQIRLDNLSSKTKAPAESAEARQALEEANLKLAQQNQAVTALTQERETLQKQVNDLAAKASADAKAAAELEQTRQALADSNRKLTQQTEVTSALTREKEVLQKQVDYLSATDAATVKIAVELEQTKRAWDEAQRKLNQQTETAAGWAKEKESLQKRLDALTAEASKVTAVGDEVRVLQERVNRTEADKALLEAKLREALAAQPAAIDPRELAKAEGKIQTLQKENELLKTSLQQLQSKAGQPADTAALAQTKQTLTDARRKLAAQTEAATLLLAEANNKLGHQDKIVASLTQERNALQKRLEPLAANADAVAALRAENEVLKKQLATEKSNATPPVKGEEAAQSSPQVQAQLAALQSERDMLRLERIALEQKFKQQLSSATPAVAPSPAAADQALKIKRLEQERDELQRKLAAASKGPAGRAGTPPAAQVLTLSNQINALRAKLEVLEAKPVPYTTAELALLRRPEPNLAAVEPKLARKSIRDLPVGGVTLVAEGQRYFAAKQFDKAEEKYVELLRQDNQNVYTLANLAAIQLELGRLDEAEKNVKQALALDPDDAFSLGILGAVKFRQGKYDEALEALSRAAQLNPQNAQVQNYLGITLSHKGMRDPAETALRKAVQLDPGYASAHNNLAVIYATQQPPSLEMARLHYQKALDAGHSRNPDLEKILDANKPAESSR